MSRLEKYHSSVRANPELIRQYELEVRLRGEHQIKADLASARRTATVLKKTSGQFGWLPPEQKLALDAAASTLNHLAADLALLATWAKGYAAYCKVESAREISEELAAFSLKRWGAPGPGAIIALEFEVSIINAAIRDGSVGQWFHSNCQQTDVPPENIRLPFIHRLDIRTAAKEIQYESKWHDDPHKGSTRDGPHLVVSWRQYEAFLAHRRLVAAQVTESVCQS